MSMNDFTLRVLRDNYKEGTKVRLKQMNDAQAPPVGTIGVVTHVDDACQIHVNWENGSTLALVPFEDKWELIND